MFNLFVDSQHVIAAVMFEHLAAQKERPYEEDRLKRRLEAWLVSKGKHDSQLGALWNSSRMISDGGREQREST